MCGRGCSLQSPGCGRGEAYARQLEAGPDRPVQTARSRDSGERHGSGRRPARRSHPVHSRGPREGSDSLCALLRQCGHALYHSGAAPEAVTAALTEEEEDTLRYLLQKVLTALNGSQRY